MYQAIQDLGGFGLVVLGFFAFNLGASIFLFMAIVAALLPNREARPRLRLVPSAVPAVSDEHAGGCTRRTPLSPAATRPESAGFRPRILDTRPSFDRWREKAAPFDGEHGGDRHQEE